MDGGAKTKNTFVICGKRRPFGRGGWGGGERPGSGVGRGRSGGVFSLSLETSFAGRPRGVRCVRGQREEGLERVRQTGT